MRAFAIVLNGTSSSGKSTIAAEIQRLWGEPIFHASLDAFRGMAAAWHVRDRDLRKRALMASHENFYRFLRSFRDSEFAVIVDTVFVQDEFRRDTLAALEGIPTLLVGVHCPLPELERREQARGDRQQGLARQQFDVVHRGVPYDLEVDTGASSATQAAEAILGALRTRFQASSCAGEQMG
jgi:chloramphenicol 3-O phosphotransferase